MIPVDQTRFGYPNGNCVAACLASILEIPLKDLPEFSLPLYQGDRLREVNMFLYLRYRLEMSILPGQYVNDPSLPLYIIAFGNGPRDFCHAVVYSNGKMVHDPHPSRAGLLTIDNIGYLHDAIEN